MAEDGKIGAYDIGSNFTQSLDGYKDLERIRNEFEDRSDHIWGVVKSGGKKLNLSIHRIHLWPGSEISVTIPESHFSRFEKIEGILTLYIGDKLIEVDSIEEIKGPVKVIIKTKEGSKFKLHSDFNIDILEKGI